MIDLIDQFADALVAVSPEGKVLFWSLGAESVFGFTRAEATGRMLVDLIVPDDQRGIVQARIAMADAGAATFEDLRRCKDGALVYVDVSKRAVLDAEGRVAYVAISHKDVSQLRYRREAEVLEARFHSLLEATPDAMVVVNAAGRIVLANREAERLFGYAPKELVGCSIEQLVPERFRSAHPSHRAGYVADPRTRPMGASVDLLARRRDGSEFPAEISLSPVQLPEGSFTSAAIRDVSTRRKIAAKFRGLLEAAPDAIVIVDRTGKIVLVNAQTVRLFGYARDELIGQPIEMLVPRRDRDRHEGHRGSYFEEPRARAMGSEMDLHAVRKDGTEIPVEISLSPLETEDGLLVSSAIRDVSQRKHTEAALRLAYKELESFSYSIAHDLRAPLRAMSGFAQILLEDHAERLDEDGLDSLHEIRNNAVRMGELIDALLSLSRVTRTELRRERVDLAGMARAILDRWMTAEPRRRVELAIAGPLHAWTDPTLVQTLLENLLGNAWKFTRDAAPARIELGRLTHDGAKPFFIRDNGAGFDMSHAGRLFGPFQRLHTEREFPGTGIGLATAQRIVQRHGGRIWAESAVGKGATFYFTLPEREGQTT